MLRISVAERAPYRRAMALIAVRSDPASCHEHCQTAIPMMVDCCE